MTRAIYRFLVWLHPRCFRGRFEHELMGTFDDAADAERSYYAAEMLLSLLRQWLTRMSIWRVALATSGTYVPVLLVFYFERHLHLYLLSIGGVSGAPAILFLGLICLFLMFATAIAAFWFQTFTRRRVSKQASPLFLPNKHGHVGLSNRI